MNLSTLAFIILALVIRIVMVVVLRTFIILTKGKYGGYRLHSILNDNLFFNNLIKLLIESLFEL